MPNVAAQSQRGSVRPEVLHHSASLVVADQPVVEVAHEADVNRPRAVRGRRRVDRWVERVRHGDNRRSGFGVELRGDVQRQLGTDDIRAAGADEANLLVHQVVLVADEHRELAAPSLEPAGRLLEQIASGRQPPSAGQRPSRSP